MRLMMVVMITLVVVGGPVGARPPGLAPELDSLCLLSEGETKIANALWIENPAELQFGPGRERVVIADLKGPGVINMIHIDRPSTLLASRDWVIRMYWDGEEAPSVEAPVVDFFCDPNGALDRMDSILVNVKRGWNCHFPMPFARSARIELAVEDPRYPGLMWHTNPCYSYVIYRKLKSLPREAAYFHATWRQKTVLLGKEDYPVMEAEGRGQFVGWNVTVRNLAPQWSGIYPVDMNEKLYFDGEKEASFEWQGLECVFGFGSGFPQEATLFPYYGYQPYYNGAAAYRFLLEDRISFKKSLRMTVGFGKNDWPFFRETYSKPENLVQFSSVAYWYQKEPHLAFAPMLPRAERRPGVSAAAAKPYRDEGEAVVIRCGRKSGDEEFLEEGWDFVLKRGLPADNWAGEVSSCWYDKEAVELELRCPKGVSGRVRLFIVDPDRPGGGRREAVTVGGRLIGEYEEFGGGRWVEAPVSAADTAGGRIPIIIKNLNAASSAAVSVVRFRRGE
jgi:hypothetical protein